MITFISYDSKGGLPIKRVYIITPIAQISTSKE
jgi:hypothetical protein